MLLVLSVWKSKKSLFSLLFFHANCIKPNHYDLKAEPLALSLPNFVLVNERTQKGAINKNYNN